MRDRTSFPRPAWFSGVARTARANLRRGFPLLALGTGLLLLSIVRSVSLADAPSASPGTRLEAFQDAAPETFGFLDRWFRRNEVGRHVDAVTLITEEVRREFFEEVPYGPIIHEKARKYELDPILVAAIVEVESSFDLAARSPKGAVGLMQLRPSTGRWMGAANLLDPTENIEAGTKYLKYLEERFDGDLNRQLAAYNAGEGTVMRYGGVPPYPETIRYIRKVRRKYERWNRNLRDFSREQSESQSR